MDVFQEKIIPPTRSTPLEWTVVRRKFGMVVAPITPDGRFLLVRQERIPIRMALWEFPAGQVEDSHPDTIIATLHRELREETGYELAPNATITPLGYFFSSQGFTDEHAYLFAATPVIPSGQARPEYDETILEVKTFSMEELRSMIANNEIRDGNTLALFARMIATGFITPESYAEKAL